MRSVGRKYMNDNDFYKYLEQARLWLSDKQKLLSNNGIGKSFSYKIDQETEIIKFDMGLSIIKYNFIPIGSFKVTEQEFQWAWSNHNILNKLREKSKIFISLNDITDSKIFADRKIEADQIMAWDIAAMCGQLINSVGIYAPEKNDIIRFYALKEIEFTN